MGSKEKQEDDSNLQWFRHIRDSDCIFYYSSGVIYFFFWSSKMSWRFGGLALSQGLFWLYVGFSAFSKANFTVCTWLAEKYDKKKKPLKIYKPLKILCLEERKFWSIYGFSKDIYPKGSRMNMIIVTPFSIYWIRSEGSA